jgi:hypothetical protein
MFINKNILQVAFPYRKIYYQIGKRNLAVETKYAFRPPPPPPNTFVDRIRWILITFGVVLIGGIFLLPRNSYDQITDTNTMPKDVLVESIHVEQSEKLTPSFEPNRK